MHKRVLNIKTVKELSLQLSCGLEYLNNVYSQFNGKYNKFIQETKKGKKRTFYSADQDLKYIHNKINKLLNRIEYPVNFQGGLKNRSIFKNCMIHKGKRFLYSFDIKKFFPSITPKMVYKSFMKQNCSPNVSRFLTRLTTADYLLPQGFSTSPKISVLVLFDINNRLKKLLEPMGLKHTFWIDDLTISGNLELDKNTENKIDIIFKQYGFELHKSKEKRKRMNNRQKQKCLGLVINREINIDKREIIKTKSDLYKINKFGLFNFIKLNNENKDNFIKKLTGRINYFVYINKKNKKLKEKFSSILKKEGIK